MRCAPNSLLSSLRPPSPQDDVPYIIEANPRASRTVPFVAKAVGHPIAKYASLLMGGKSLKDIGFTEVRGRGGRHGIIASGVGCPAPGVTAWRQAKAVWENY